MFDRSKFFKIRLFNWFLDDKPDFYYSYVFDEDQNNIIDVHDTLWETGKAISAKNQLIRYGGGGNENKYPNGRLLQLLHYTIQFNGRLFIDLDLTVFSKTYLGFYDLSLEPAARIPQFHSLLPHVTAYDKIWINDLEMAGSPTYFVDLFETKLWLAFFATFMLIGFLSSVGIFALKKFNKDKIDHLNWFSITVNQGANENSKFISRRFLLISLAAVVIIFHSAFESFMSSSLAIRHPDLPFSDILSLLKLPAYTICALSMTSALEQITHDAGKVARPPMINSAACPNIFHNFDGTAKSIKDSEKSCPKKNVVYIGQGMCFMSEMSEKCRLSAIRGKYFYEYVSFAIYPGFKYREQFNQGILRLRSSGHMAYTVQQFEQTQLHDVCSKRFIAPEPDIQVSFHQISLLLLWFQIGMASSIITLIFELIYKKM